MLVLSRKVGERIVIAGDIVVQVMAVNGGRVRLGIDAPASVGIWREECVPRESWTTDEEESTLACVGGRLPQKG
jgi:carbon storage regulator